MKHLVKLALSLKKKSKSNLVKVGCVIWTPSIPAIGYNGNGFMGGDLEDETGKTKPGVIHAEADAVAYAAKHSISLADGKMLITLAPCMNCAALISNSGIREVWYIDTWWDVAAIELLQVHGVRVVRLRKAKADTSPHHTSPSIS